MRSLNRPVAAGLLLFLACASAGSVEADDVVCETDNQYGVVSCGVAKSGVSVQYAASGGQGAVNPGPARVDPCTYTSLASDTPAFTVEVRGDEVWVLHRIDCPGKGSRMEWLLVNTDDPAQAAVADPVVTPAMLIPDLFDSVQRVLPRPIPRVAPADSDSRGFAYVNVPTFFWVDQAPGQWEVVSGTASVPGLSVTIQAEPVEFVVAAGDGQFVHCPGAPPPFGAGDRPSQFDGCGYTYPNSSAMAGNGETYPLQVSIVWHITWSASNGESGDLGELLTRSDVRALAVAEIQAVVVSG